MSSSGPGDTTGGAAMRVEEHCRCGASLAVDIDMTPDAGRAVAQQYRAAWLRGEVWKQVERWRKMHAACREVPPPVARP